MQLGFDNGIWLSVVDVREEIDWPEADARVKQGEVNRKVLLNVTQPFESIALLVP